MIRFIAEIKIQVKIKSQEVKQFRANTRFFSLFQLRDLQ